MNSWLVPSLLAILTAAVGFFTYLAATKANREAAKTAGKAIDAAAFSRAEDIYLSALQAARDDVASARQDLATTRTDLAATRLELATARNDLTSLRSELHQLRQGNEALTIEMAKLRAEIQNGNNRKDTT